MTKTRKKAAPSRKRVAPARKDAAHQPVAKREPTDRERDRGRDAYQAWEERKPLVGLAAEMTPDGVLHLNPTMARSPGQCCRLGDALHLDCLTVERPLDLNLWVAWYRGAEPHVVQRLEEVMWDLKRPLFGRRGR